MLAPGPPRPGARSAFGRIGAPRPCACSAGPLRDWPAVLAIALALGSSACYGVSNFVGPQLARRHAIVTVLVVSQLAALAGCAIYLAADRSAALPASGLVLALLAGCGNAAGLIGFYRAAELGRSRWSCRSAPPARSCRWPGDSPPGTPSALPRPWGSSSPWAARRWRRVPSPATRAPSRASPTRARA